MLCLPKTFLTSLLTIMFFHFIPAINTSFAEEKKKAVEKISVADSFIETDNYVHNWVPLPTIEGHDLNGKAVKQSPERGLLDVIIFIASWCIQCQQLIGYIQDLDKKYTDRHTRFTYIFSHDLKSDAQGFAKAFKIDSAIVASHDILKAYHNPELPSIYIGDRHGWLLARYLKATPKELKKIDEVISYLTAY